MEKPLSRDNNFNFIRFVLASLVILAHSPELVDGNRNREILTLIFGSISWGELAVDGFFLLSGFLIVQSWQRNPNFFDFFKKRVLRIYPGFVVASLVSALIVGPLGSDAIQYLASFDPLSFLKGIILLQLPAVPRVFEGQPYPYVNGAIWTIEYEFRCYMIVALLGLCATVKQKQIWLILSILALLLAWYSNPDMGFLGRHPLRSRHFLLADPISFLKFLPFFFIGGCFYLFRNRIVYKSNWALAAAIALCGCLFYKPTAELSLAIFGSYILFWFAFASIPRLEMFKRSADVSYGVYLYGWPIQKLLLWYVPSLSPWALFPLALGLSCICGWLSWHGVEQPFLRLKRQPEMSV